jgi:hypothetical protein
MPRFPRSILRAGPLLAMALAASPAAGNEGGGGATSVVPVAAELRVPIFDGGRFAGTLRIQTALDYADPAQGASAAAHAPMFRDAVLSAGLEFARLHVSAFTPIDAALLSRTLTDAARTVDPHVRKVLILDVSARQ